MSSLAVRDASSKGAKLAIILSLSLILSFLLVLGISLVLLVKYYKRKNLLRERENRATVDIEESNLRDSDVGYQNIQLDKVHGGKRDIK